MKFFELKGIPKLWIIGVFGIKILAGALLAYIYTHVYPNRIEADVFRYFDESKIIYNTLFSKPLDFLRFITGIDNENPCMDHYYIQMPFWRPYQNNLITKVNALMRLFSMGFFYTHTVFFCFLSLLGQVGILRVFAPHAPSLFKKRLLLIALCLMPSVLLWSSGPLKDSISFFGFGLLFYHLTQLLRSRYYWHWSRVIWVLSLLILLYLNKVYIVIAALPSFTLYVLMQMSWFKTNAVRPFTDKLLLKIILIHFLFISLLTITSLLPKQVNIPFRIANKQTEFIKIGEETSAGSYIPTKKLEPDSWNILESLPIAVYRTLVRPSFLQAHTELAKIAAAENLLIALSLLISLLCARSHRRSIALLIFSFGLTLWLFALIGLTTPIIGAMVRYKVISLPFLMGACVILFDEKVFITRFRMLTWKNVK